MADDNELKQLLCQLLLEKVREDRYPSGTMMDIIENEMDEDVRNEYVHVLAEKIAGDQYPSIDMLRRVFSVA
jgi:hypothetical protein